MLKSNILLVFIYSILINTTPKETIMYELCACQEN